MCPRGPASATNISRWALPVPAHALVQATLYVRSMPLFSNLLCDHDLITTAHGRRDTLCARDPIITTTIIGSIAHNLSA